MIARHVVQRTFDVVCEFKADDGCEISVEVSPDKVKAMFGFYEADSRTMSKAKAEALFKVLKPLALKIFDGVPKEYKFEFMFSE